MNTAFLLMAQYGGAAVIPIDAGGRLVPRRGDYAGVLTASLAGFRTAHPEVELQLTEMEMGLQFAAIAGGALDVGYIRPPVTVPAGVATTCVLREPLVVAVGAAPRARRSRGDSAGRTL